MQSRGISSFGAGKPLSKCIELLRHCAARQWRCIGARHCSDEVPLRVRKPLLAHPRRLADYHALYGGNCNTAIWLRNLPAWSLKYDQTRTWRTVQQIIDSSGPAWIRTKDQGIMRPSKSRDQRDGAWRTSAPKPFLPPLDPHQ
jgi:hypothetical protein